MAAFHPVADAGREAFAAFVAAAPGSAAQDIARHQMLACLIRLGTIEHGYAALVAEEIEQDRLDNLYAEPDAGVVVMLRPQAGA